MQLLSDKVIIEKEDFDFGLWTERTPKNLSSHNRYKTTPEERREALTRKIEKWAADFTLTFNRRLLLFSNGRKSKNMLKWAIMVFGYLWKNGSPKSLGGFKWIALTELERNFLQYRRVGRPKTRTSTQQHYVVDENNPIPRQTTLAKILKDLVKVDLVSFNRGLKNEMYYKVSETSISDKISFEEKYFACDRAYFKLVDEWYESEIRYQKALTILREMKIEKPEEKVEELLRTSN